MVNKSFQCTSIILSFILVIVFAELPRNENSCSTSEQLLRSAKTDVKNKQKSIIAKKENYASNRRHVANFNSFERCNQPKKINKKTKKAKEKIGKISKHDFELLCDLVAAEAEDQPFEGKRAVVAVVLNRKEFGKPFEKTIEGVIFQKGQFSCIADKRFFRAHKYVSEEDKKAVREELKQRSDKEILFFTAGKYGKYGNHAYRIGDHFFCKK